MLTYLEKGTRLLGEAVVRKVLDYIEKDPRKNLPKAIDLLLQAPIATQHKEILQGLREHNEFFEHMAEVLDPAVLKKFFITFLFNTVLYGIPKQYKMAEEVGAMVPYSILIDPTSACNLNCVGCWAGAYTHHDSLSFEEMDRIITEAKELGIYFFPISGGEPYLWPHLLQLFERHSDAVFMTYTNGTRIDAEMAAKLAELGNVSPAISLEGPREVTDARRGNGVFDKVMAAMDNLRAAGVPFGFSVTLTRQNCEAVVNAEFLDLMIEKGALYGWSFHYIPIGKDPDFSLMLTPEQRSWLVHEVRALRSTRPILLVDFWNDGAFTHGCIAGGRYFFHITAKGDIEPCAFVHFASDNIKGKSLKEALHTPLFKAYQKRQPFSTNVLRPCPLIDRPEALREIVAESGAKPTHPGADATIVGNEAGEMTRIAEAWKQRTEEDHLEEALEDCAPYYYDELREIGGNLDREQVGAER